MPKISAFRGLRYDLGHVGSLGRVIAPAAIRTPDVQDELYKRHPANSVRLIANRSELGDKDGAPISRSGRFLRHWQRQGLLQHEPDPAIYVYHQTFQGPAGPQVRRGFIGRVELEPWGSGIKMLQQGTVEPNEIDGHKNLLAVCEASLCPILGLYTGEHSGSVQPLLDEAVKAIAPIQAQEETGRAVHRIWPVTDIRVINEVTSKLANATVLIAEGASIYAAGLAHQNDLGGSDLPANHGARHTMMCLVESDQLSLCTKPIHRLISGSPMSKETIQHRLEPYFHLSIIGEGVDLVETVWEEIESASDVATMTSGTFGIYAVQDDCWLLARVTEAGLEALASSASDRTEEWRSLSSAMFNQLVLGGEVEQDELLLNSVSDLVHHINANKSSCAMAAMMLPPTQDHLGLICESGEQLPRHSTKIYPSLVSGLVFYPHDA